MARRSPILEIPIVLTKKEEREKQSIKRSCSVRSAIDKGARFQRSILGKLRAAFRLPMYYSIRSSVGRESGADIKYQDEATKKLVGLAIECKNCRSLNIFRAIEQAKKYREDDSLHEAVIFKYGGLGSYIPYIAITLDHYLDLRKKLIEHGIEIKSPKSKRRRVKETDDLLANTPNRVVRDIPGGEALGEAEGCSERSCDGEES